MDHVVHSLTGAQYGMWLGQQMSPDVAFTVAQYVDISGPFDVETMQAATREASDEFLSPYVRIEVDESGTPVQWLDRSIDCAAQVIDLGLARPGRRRDHLGLVARVRDCRDDGRSIGGSLDGGLLGGEVEIGRAHV